MRLTVQVAAAAPGRVFQAVIWKQMLFSGAKQPRAVVVGWPAALAGQPKQERKLEARKFGVWGCEMKSHSEAVDAP